MLAVVELGGNQFIVKVGDVIEVKKMEGEPNSTFSVPALLVSDKEGKETKVGTPSVDSSKVEFKIKDQFLGDKVRVFKMKSKKRYKRNVGFRPALTKLEVLSIA